jgi:hypothetical protein
MTPRNPAAPDHLPFFLPTQDGSDPLLIVTAFIVLTAVVLIGVLFFRLHSLPEQFGHKKVQYELVAVLALISLLTHIHLFWVIALVLAMIDLPDFTTPLQRIAAALERRWSPWPKPAIETPGGEPKGSLDEGPSEKPRTPSIEKSSGEKVHASTAKERKELYAMSAGSEDT